MHADVSDGMISHYVHHVGHLCTVGRNCKKLLHLDSYTGQLRNLTYFEPKAIYSVEKFCEISSTN